MMGVQRMKLLHEESSLLRFRSQSEGRGKVGMEKRKRKERTFKRVEGRVKLQKGRPEFSHLCGAPFPTRPVAAVGLGSTAYLTAIC